MSYKITFTVFLTIDAEMEEEDFPTEQVALESAIEYAKIHSFKLPDDFPGEAVVSVDVQRGME
jgi:hypothetical protein